MKIVALATEIDRAEKAVADLTEKLAAQRAHVDARMRELAAELAPFAEPSAAVAQPPQFARRTPEEVRAAMERLKTAVKHVLRGGRELDKAGILAVAGDVSVRDWKEAIAELLASNQVRRVGAGPGLKYALA
jgi:hypothetical protein